MVVSQKHIAVIDPHRKCIKTCDTSPAGTKKKLTSFFEYSGHVSTFESIFELNTQEKKYKGTIFRFPLRQPESGSDISDKPYTPEMIQKMLFESLKEESSYILLFLRNIKSISLMEWRANSTEACETFRVELKETVTETSSDSNSAQPHAEQFARQCSQGSETDSSEVFVELSSVTVGVHNIPAVTSPTEHHWLVMRVIGTNDNELGTLGRELSIIPWVGLATRLPVEIVLNNCETRTSMPFDDGNTLEEVLRHLDYQIQRLQLSIMWSDVSAASTDGHAYCFLPLPESTAMPVHVHGYFAVTDNRRSIKWPAHDEKGKEAQWNKELLYKMLAPSYALLLACRTSLIHYKESPLSVTNTDNVTDAYSTWPLYHEVKNVQIWNELISPTLSFSSSLPLLWTSACGGKWVQFSEAYFLPGSFTTNSHSCSPIVIQLLKNLDMPVVSLPKGICETIKQSEHVMRIVKHREISPQFFRQIIKSNPRCCSSLSQEEVYEALAYVLHDINEFTCHNLVGIPLLPLKIEAAVSFERLRGDNHKYIFPSKSTSLVNILPGADNLIVDSELPNKTAKKLCEIAGAKCLQLVEVNMEVMCKQLLPVSIRSWCKKRTEIGWNWTPGRHLMPPQSWMDALWKWVGKSSVSLSLLQELPIVPLLTLDNSQHEEVTLVKPNKSNLCRLSISFPSKDKTALTGILKKLGFSIVDESKMNNCDKMKKHPDFKEFFPRLSLSLELIVKHLGRLSAVVRLETVKSLHYNEKDFLRKHFSYMGDSCANYKDCLRSIPIYRAACNDAHSPHFIALGNKHKDSSNAFLPPENVSSLPDYPSNMLCPTTSPDERSFYKALSVKQLNLSKFCVHHLIPLALKHIQNVPNSWSVGDELVLWILKQQHLAQNVFDSLSQYEIIYTRSSSHKSPQNVINPQDQALTTLFDIESDSHRFPDEQYLQDRRCKQALSNIGMKTWKDFQADHAQMHTLLLDRMQSIHNLDSSMQISRGEFILLTLVEPANRKLWKYVSLYQCHFLRAEPCPTSYPHCLKEKWYGQKDELYSIEELCPPSGDTNKWVGTVKPILSREYSFGRHAVSMRVYEIPSFQKVTEVDVLKHLTNLESTVVDSADTDKFSHIVMSVYEYLLVASFTQKLQHVWWRDTETPKFLPANKFVIELPENLHMNILEPYYYLLRAPVRKYARMFHLHKPLTPTDVAGVVKGIAEHADEKKLTNKQIDTCISVLNWLCEKQYKEPAMLMLTEECTLVPAMKCVFDDRNWMKDSRSKGQIKSKSLLFTHDKIPQKVAKHFHVIPLSRKVAPSQRLGISYTKAGQHEDITHRIRHIVQDYGTNIDIFKELIQNADDAGATEVKFLIDWRHHPTESLIAEELKAWQGPALIAYNNATFSDEDFDNICMVAGETKKNNPLKTGRFGVGFCATYHLTDLPSFISRKFFTMFDPHTSYLGDRISAQEPGMRVNLVENQSDLELYHDQFKPYEDLFDCRVFNLPDDGYPGTLFRFPFRSSLTSKNSKICKTIYDRGKISTLETSLKDHGGELILFLKHITKVSIFELEKDSNPSAPRKVFTVQRKGNSKERTKLISHYSDLKSGDSRTCSSKFVLEVQDGTKKDSCSTWIISSAIEGCTDIQLINSPEAEGLLPLAEIALKVDPSKDIWKCLPTYDLDKSKIFCFLPLPIKSKLPFHVNGFFSIGKDRRNILATDDKSFGSRWNESLAEGALYSAFLNLLQNLNKECHLHKILDTDVKQQYLHCYYSLWTFSVSGFIGETFVNAFKKRVPELTCPLIWSEVSGGCWLSPKEVVVFQDKKLDQHDVIKKDATSALLSHGYGLANLPHHVRNILKSSLKNTGRLFNYQRFCEEILFKEIDSTVTEVHNRNIKFLVEQFGVHSEDNWCQWAKEFLSANPCISCQDSDILSKGSKLIDPTNNIFKKLFDVHEGRFPSKELQKSSSAMKGLRVLGMTHYKLSVTELKERAETVRHLDHQHAVQRSEHLSAYIECIYGSPSIGGHSHVPPSKELQELSSIPFLPVKQKPDDIDVPWSGVAKTFESPLQVYSPFCMHLIFSQHPVTNITSSEVLRCLGISTKQPTLDTIISHLKCISQYITSKPDDTTIKFMEESMERVYSHLEIYYSEAKDINKVLQVGKIIWQDGYFLSPDQVVCEWKQSYIPYLCELSSANKRISFIRKLGVKEKPTIKMLEHILQQITCVHSPHVPLDDDVLIFVEFVVSRLASEVKFSQHEERHSLKIFLPDENKIMRDVSQLAENVGHKTTQWVTKLEIYGEFMSSGDSYFVHSSISRERAITLGVKPLLEAVVKEIEDDNFLSGTDFGQQEDLCDRLNGILRKYPPDVSIFQEFIQNADDAQATEIIFVLDHRTKYPDNTLVSSKRKWKLLQHTPALCIFNNRKFTEADIEGITKLGRGGKDRAPDLIGKFGIGFNVAYHITDCPSFVSYAESGAPEYLCVFDPTRSFLPLAKSSLPGKKWDFEDGRHFSGFSDQFQPYLAEDLPKLMESAPKTSQDKKHGHVMFRLPLTRYDEKQTSTESNISRSRCKSKLDSGAILSPSELSHMFDTFATISQDMLLFLNHLRHISVFEILRDGKYVHRFTTSGSIPDSYLGNFEQYSRSLKQCVQMIERGRPLKKVSLPHQMSIVHAVTKQREQYCSKQKSQWLVQRVIGGSELNSRLLRDGLHQGLRPVGGVATLLKPMPTYEYRLFCYLPLPIQSYLPVHVNGHFLVDDSRKHLETILHEGLGGWNHSLAQHVIVPAYIDLVTTAKDLLSTIDDSGDHIQYYSLFPRPNAYDIEASSIDGTNVGELDNLNIVHNFYARLLQQNSPVIIRKMQNPSSKVCWMPLRNCLFCVEFLYKQKWLSVHTDVCNVLVSLGLPIANAPDFIYHGCSKADDSFRVSARVEPRKIVHHLRSLTCTKEQKEVIKNNIQPLLKYCIAGYDSNEVKCLFTDALYLIAYDGTLQHGTLFQSAFSKLLPHCAHKFIDPKLEKSEVGRKLCLDHHVICPLTLNFVSTHINLPQTYSCCDLDASNLHTVKLLWECIANQSESRHITQLLTKHFSSKAIIPTSDAKLYPVCMSKALVRDTSDGCDQCRVMKKLGYAQIDFSQVGFIDKSSDVHWNVINVLTSCFQDGEDIVDCLQLQKPKKLDIQLSEEEAQSFSHLLGKVPRNHLHQVSKYLLDMPLFYTIDGSRTSLHGATKVFILNSNDIPLQGISSACNGQIVLNAASSKVMEKFYNDVIPGYLSAPVSSEQFYIQVILPILPELSEDNIKRHLKYLYLHKDDDMKRAFLELKKVAFVKHHGQFYRVTDLCDPCVMFFAIFHHDSILPATWCDESTIPILKNLGLRTQVTTVEWLECARCYAEGYFPNKSPEKSRVLLGKLIEFVKDHSQDVGKLTTFLEAASDIEFIYCPQEWQLNSILSQIFSDQMNSNLISMVKMRGSVSFQEADLACLCKPVLPESCQQLTVNSAIRNALHIEVPVSSATVAKNLKHLCNRLNTTCARPPTDANSEHVKKLVKIFKMHYACLSSKKPSPGVLSDFKNMMCVLLPSKPSLLQLIKPSQLVMQLPSGCFLEPYCYRADSLLQKYMDFLTSIGVRQELKAQDYVNILGSIQEVFGDDGSIDDRTKKVVQCAYFELVRCLRQGDSLTGDVNIIWLPDQTMKLVKVQSLCLNDAPWYEDRLPEDCGLKMILPPPTDDKGLRTLPKHLKVKLLSEIITEELMESCKSPDSVCNYEELFALGKRSEDRRCLFVRKILETLKSKELFHGLCRMYYTEHHVSPEESFMLTVQKLKQVQVRCITKIRTVLCVNGQVNPSTEDSSKLCYVCKEGTSFALYISPHNDALEEDLLKDLAFCIRKLIDNEVHDLVPIAAAFECEPSGIPQALNRHNVSQYTPSDDKQAKPVIVGTPVSWDRLNHEDSLIVLNFDPEDPVRYICDDGTLINAEVVSCKPTDHSKMVGFLKPTITIKVREDDKGSDASKDQRDSDDSSTDDGSAHTDDNVDSDNKINERESDHEDEHGLNDHDAVTKVVSPMQVFKLLTIPQRRSLWGEGASPFACPVVLALLPFKDFTSIEEWLHEVYDSSFISTYSELTLKVLTLRLLRHMHYLLVIQKKAPMLFNRAALKIYDIIVQKEHACDTVDHKWEQMQKVMKLLTKMMENLSLEDVSDDDDDDSELAVFKVSRRIFPSRSLVKIMDMGNDDDDDISDEGKNRRVNTHGNPTSYHSQVSHRQLLSAQSSHTSSTVSPSPVQRLPAVTGANQPPANTLSRFSSGTRLQRRRQHQTSRFQPVTFSAPQVYVPQPKTCMQSATAWLEQAKADFKAAGRLLISQDTNTLSSTEACVAMGTEEEEFPALVCFLCHDTVEKCIKGILYANCGLKQNLVDCGNLVTLMHSLDSSPHCPRPLFDIIKECVMTVNRHEHRSRFPNYQNPPCAPASIYDTEDAEEAYLATKKFLELLKSEQTFCQVLGDLGQMPAKKFVSTLRSMPDNQGMNYCMWYHVFLCVAIR